MGWAPASIGRATSAVVVISMFVACAAALRQPTLADVARAKEQGLELTLDDLQRGRRLYAAHCAGCHNLYRPESRDADHWPKLVTRMADKAKLHVGEVDEVVRYLQLMSQPSEVAPERRE